MKCFYKACGRVTTTLLIAVLISACASDESVSYSQTVKPVLDLYCLGCHQPGGKGFEASGFSMATYAELMKGTTNGPMVIPGDPLGSNLLVLMEGRADPSIAMPHDKSPGATDEEIASIRQWIEQGALDN